MLKYLLFFLLTFLTVTADEKVEIYASDMDTVNSIVHASGDVAVVYKDYYLSASRAVYNKNTGDLELFDNVRANQGIDHKILGNYAKLNIKNKERSFQPFYMFEKQSELWISGDSCKTKDNIFDIESGVLSGCDPNDPLWKMEFTSSDYDTDSKWINLYNTRLYIYDIPVFYTPWFGYSLDKTRRTGILQPSFGLSSGEGFYLDQPFYIAEYDSWDLELKPQIRTNRGEGMYATFRFADSKVSKGELVLGGFKEKEEYFLANDLANDKHYGYNFKYENTDILNELFGTNLDGQSGLYIDLNYMNDVDYINLSSSDTFNISTATQVLSRVNMFYNTDENYMGTYIKRYQDLTLESNENTLQQFPTLHYHHYLESLLDDHILYNVDIQSNNIYRDVNKRVIQTDVNIPVSIHTSLFNEYIDLSYKTNFYAQQSTFGGTEKVATTDEYQDGYIARNTNVIGVSTQLTKAYDEFSHVVGFGTNYTFEGSEVRDGFYTYNEEFCQDPDNSNEARCEFYSIAKVQEELHLEFSQYLYDALGKQKLYHKLSQSIQYLGTGTSEGDLENEVSYMVTDDLLVYNNMFYNHQNNKFSKIFNRLAYNDEVFNFSISHLYRNTFQEVTPTYTPITSYLTSTARYKYNSHYSYSFAYDYDMELKAQKRREIGFLYTKRCWDFGFRYVENSRPILARSGTTSRISERYVYFNISFKPFMATGNADSSLFAYKFPDSP